MLLSPTTDEHWKWRIKMAETIAGKISKERFGIKAIYIIGSTQSAIAGPASDIDLLIHFNGDDIQKKELKAWLEGWSLCLSEMNYNKTGYRVEEGLIDLHLITDEDIRKKTSFAVLINSADHSARRLN